MKTAFGNNLRALRMKQNMSQRSLAEAINVTHATIAAYENSGKFPQRLSIRKNLIKVLDCTEEELYGYSDGYYATKSIIEPTTTKEAKKGNESFSNNKILNKNKTEVIETSIYNFENNKFSKVKRTKRAIDINTYEKHKKGFFIHLNDESMDRFIAKDSYVFIDPKGEYKDFNEHVCAVTKDGFETIMRRIKFLEIDNLITLIPQSNNDKYQIETIDLKKYKDFKILGKAVWFSNDGGDL